MSKPASYIADHLRKVLVDGAAAPHTAEVEKFFKDEITSRGWYTGELRKLARRFCKVIRHDAGGARLVSVADELFRGNVFEEKVLAVLFLENSVGDLTPADFRLFESWLDRVSTWADHDALCHYLIGPMMVDQPRRHARALAWSRSPHRWHRRAAAVSLIRGARSRMFADAIAKVCRRLLDDQDLMVQKGLGWLLRESAKYNPKFAIPLLRSIREQAPRLVLRTACETVSPRIRNQLLKKTPRRAAKAAY